MFEIASSHWTTDQLQAFRSVVNWLRLELDHYNLPIPSRMTKQGIDTPAIRTAYPEAAREFAETLGARIMSSDLSDTEKREAANCLRLWENILGRHGLPAV